MTHFVENIASFDEDVKLDISSVNYLFDRAFKKLKNMGIF